MSNLFWIEIFKFEYSKLSYFTVNFSIMNTNYCIAAIDIYFVKNDRFLLF